MPQRTNYATPAGPFGPTLFSTSWGGGRERSTTLSSIRSGDGPISPAQSSFSKDGMGDNDTIRTLDYLGLADSTPQQARATLAQTNMEAVLEAHRSAALQPFMTDLVGLNKNANRFRSYSVNATEKYAEDEEDDEGHGVHYPSHHSGSLTPSAATIAAANAATQAQIHQHNLAVQAFVNQATANRPRARTVGVLEASPQRSVRSYLATPSRLDNSITAAELSAADYESLSDAARALHLGGQTGRMIDASNGDNNLDPPTRALWLGSIPSSTTVTSLNAIFAPFGKIESARVLTHKNCGFVNFEHPDSAVQAKSILNGKEIFPGAGPVRIGYAKVPDSSANGTPGHNGTYPSPSPDPFAKNSTESKPGAVRQGSVGAAGPLQGAQEAEEPTTMDLHDIHADILKIVEEFGATETEQANISSIIEKAVSFQDFQSEVPSIPEPSHSRIHDAPKLREIRKRIDNSSCSQTEIEEIAKGMIPEIAELSSDYLGNTVVQKLFEFCPENVKEMMLNQIAPHLAEIGCHKNGTWAAQKIIDVAKTPTQMGMIVDSLRSYTVPLFLDQYGNYVIQCCLRFGYPFNNFIFEVMLSRMWDIAQGRFGARAMRACLESHHANKDQQRMLAASVALNSVQLATNANGALLLTWFLDTCTFPGRRTVLAPKLVPHLVHLCTHKVAYLTVLKVINQRNEPEARDMILKALFFSPNDQILQDILSDQVCGATLIFKVLTTPFFDENMRTDVVQNVRDVLLRLKAQPAQGYKRLMDEVGLSTRNAANGPATSRDASREHPPSQSPARGRAGSQNRTAGTRTPQQAPERQYSGQYFPNVASPAEPAAGMQRNPSTEQSNTMQAFEQFGLNGLNSPMFTPNPNVPLSPITPQQLQYQQLLAAQAARTMQSGPFYGGFTPGLGGYPTPSPSLESFRNAQAQAVSLNGAQGQMSPNPLVGQGFVPQASFGMSLGNGVMPGGFAYPAAAIPQMSFFPQQQQQQMHQQGGGRRGRVSSARNT